MRRCIMSTDSIVIARMLYNNDTCYLQLPDFELERNMMVLVETPNGPEIAQVSGIGHACSQAVKIGKILRLCTEEDLKKRDGDLERAREAREITLDKIHSHDLDMKLVSIHFFFDDSKILFNFTADGRVDFRELVKDLASVFRTRIELRQIGARDEAKIITGYGVCGREFCCNAIKHELEPVTIRMAKDQSLTLNSSKISGACGRLLCCLAYEHEAYCTVKREYPHEGSRIEYDGKTVTLSEVNILKMTATLRTENNTSTTVPLEDIKGARKVRKTSDPKQGDSKKPHNRDQRARKSDDSKPGVKDRRSRGYQPGSRGQTEPSRSMNSTR
jgi:cell fate regulator YaaT (PSP1 superfamily)